MFIIDRFEDMYAVCENQLNGDMVNIPKTELPSEVKEGDCIEMVNKKYKINYEKTSELKKDIETLTKNIWK